MFQVNEEDQKKEQEEGNVVPSVLVYKDYSLMKRLETSERGFDMQKMTAFEKKKFMEDDQAITRLHCLETQNSTLLSTADWAAFAAILVEVQGLGWVQIPPVGQKSSTPLQFNMMHVLPSSKIPFSKVPMDTMIANKMNFNKKKEKRLRDGIDIKAVRAN